MAEKFDLARMLREISEETAGKSAQNRQLTQEEIRRMVAEGKKTAAQPTAPPG
jgi:hypothetical protein